MPGHSYDGGAQYPDAQQGDLVQANGDAAFPEQASIPAFDALYEQHVDYLFRAVRRLGVGASDVEDVVQEVFLTVHRKLAQFEGRSTLKTWLFGIAIHVVRDARRRARRKPSTPSSDREFPDTVGPSPEHAAGQAEAVALLHALLDGLDDDKREVFVLAELEQCSAPEIATALQLNVNTVYARLRAARQQFERTLARHRARSGEAGAR